MSPLIEVSPLVHVVIEALVLIVFCPVLIMVNRSQAVRLRGAAKRAEELQADLQDLRDEKIATTAQMAILSEHETQFHEMKRDHDTIALYLRQHYGEEIAAGNHNGRPLGEVITAYLGRERDEKARKTTAGQSERPGFGKGGYR